MIRITRVASRLVGRGYATATVYGNKKSTLKAGEDAAADFAVRNAALFASNKQAYPLLQDVVAASSQSRVMRVNEYVSKYSTLLNQAEETTDRVCVQGRVQSIRRAGKKLMFVDLVQDGHRVQVVINSGRLEEFSGSDEDHKMLRKGDHVSAAGMPWRTKSGELSVMATQPVQLVSPCLHPLPANLKDDTLRKHNRVVDMIVHAERIRALKLRHTVMTCIRAFLNSREFTEVSTPIISSQAGGAAATPFTTSSTALSSDGTQVQLAMRVAPELWLKRLVVGGLEKVYEIGPCFRNEGIDGTHNPEFYSCEFYQSFASLEDLIAMTESLLRQVVTQVSQSHPDLPQAHMNILVDMFSRPFKRIDFVSELEAQTGHPLPSDLSLPSLQSYFTTLSITPQGDTPAALLDQLASHYLEPLCQSEPTIIMHHPQVMSPLAKSAYIQVNGQQRHISRRFELFINGREYVNAYEEENSPQVQLKNFQDQAGEEGVVMDQGYVDALEWGLPPTGGWGMGIDRLVMLLSDSKRIDDVLSFGTVKSVNYQ